MSSPFVKSKLKAARDAITKKEYDKAKDNALQVLDYEPENYNAIVFLGLAHLELNEYADSEKFFRKAIDLSPKQPLAWQGLLKFYERREEWDQCAKTTLDTLDIFRQAEDVTKSAEMLQRYVDLRRKHGEPLQLVQALLLYLPSSQYYDLLSNLPPPDPTNPTSTTTYDAQSAIHNSLPILQEIVSITENQESLNFKREVDKRRMRLNAAGPEQLKRDVGKEIWGHSKVLLPDLYGEILNHPNAPDELRRETEAKLLRYKQQYLHALSESDTTKEKVRAEVLQMASDVVLLQIPDELAWTIVIESRDCDTLEGYDYPMLRQFMVLFPSHPMASFLKGYFLHIGIAESNDESQQISSDRDDPFDLMMDTYSSLSHSLLVTRVLAELYLQDSDYPNTVKFSEVGLELLRRFQLDNGAALTQVDKAFKVLLSTALVHLFPPKHHQRALGLITEVLRIQPDNVHCLMGQAYILQASKQWNEAGSTFDKVASLLSNDTTDGLRSREEAAWCKSREGNPEHEIIAIKTVLEKFETQEGSEIDQARCLWRLGQISWEMGGDNVEVAYGNFITCLKRDPSYAPAFTSLGIYYLEHSTPPDPIRASKCFQKAFELDATEAEAARRLAERFAEDQEWDLVQVITKRTIEGEGGLGAGFDNEEAISARYLPTNIWAWKAMGVVELMNTNYPASIQAFQVALRADVNDHVSWLRLGEAYSCAGRHAAAVKALARAHELDPDDWLCTYFMGDIQRQLGQFTESIESFRKVLLCQPREAGVLAALAQTYLDLAKSELSDNFVSRAEQSFVACIETSLIIIEEHAGFRALAWKTAGDALYALSERDTFFDQDSLLATLNKLTPHLSSNQTTRVSGIGDSPFSALSASILLRGLQLLHIAILAYDYRITLGLTDSSNAGSAWHDLGVALHAWTFRSKDEQDRDTIKKQSLTCLSEAIRADPCNDTFWNAFGILKFAAQPKAAQHAFIMALELDSKNVVTWTNLGLLYLYHGDTELANEMFFRAQTLDPDYTAAWIGQALVADANGNQTDADTLFEYAATLTASLPFADLMYASRAFEKLSTSKHAFGTLLGIFIVLNRYNARKPDDIEAIHLQALVSERLGHLELSAKLLENVIASLESIYELTEDVHIERRFAIANCNLARVLLSLNNFESALTSFESVLGLLSEPEEEDKPSFLLRAQAQLGSGLTHFNLGDLDAAVKSFEESLLSCQHAGCADADVLKSRVTVLLSKTLWATHTDEFCEHAKNLLLEQITADPEDLSAINALAGMGILTADEALVDAALTEILALPIDRRNALDPAHDVDYLLKQHHLAQGDVSGALSLLQTSLFTSPTHTSGRIELSKMLMLMKNDSGAMALLSGCSEDEDGGLRAMCSPEGSEALKRAQRAVMLRPGKMETWRALAYACSLLQHS